MTYDYPQTDDVEWGPEATDWAGAVTVGMLQKAGGLFQLLAEVDFGTTYGLKSVYVKTRTTNPADAGSFRLAKTDVVSWRNNANSGNLDLGISASDVLQFNGADIQGSISVTDTATIDLTFLANVLSADIKSDSITNAMINSAAAIAYAKLALTGSIVNADVNASAAIAYSKLALTGSIVNADVNTSAAIAYSKLALTGSILNADINTSAAIAFSKLATLSSTNILVGSAGNVATSVAVTGDVTIGNTGVTAIGANKVTNAMLAQVATATFKGRTTSSTGNVEDLTVTQATALLNNMVGDSGSGGTKGLVPAPAAGDAAALKFLKADGTWVAPSGSGDVVGPASATDSGFAKFDGTTGKLLKNSAATISNGDVASNAAIAFSKLAALTSAHILVGNVSNVAVDVAVSGDISLTNAGVTAYVGTVPLNKGGTGQTAKAAAFDALQPMTTGGDLIYGGASGTGTRLANGSAGQFLKSAGSTSAPAWSSFTPPSVQKFTSGTSATYTTPAGCIAIKVTLTGGGAGGGGSGTSGGSNGTAGNSTTFHSSTAAGGASGASGVNGAGGGAGGAGTDGESPGGFANSGGTGGAGVVGTIANSTGGLGGISWRGGNGSCGVPSGGTAVANSGSGGGGGGSGAVAAPTGGGGGAGATVITWIASPSATYTYTIGGTAAGGTAGASGAAGGAGAAGYILVEEFYN